MKREKKSDRLWLVNTSRYDNAEVWPLIKAAFDSCEASLTGGAKMPNIKVVLTNCQDSYRGRAHWTEREWTNGVSKVWQRVLVRIGSPKRFEKPMPVRYPRFKTDMPEYEIRSHREAIVMVTAHEIEHVLGSSGRQRGEFVCEMAAIDAIDYYRKNQVEIDGKIQALFDRIQMKDIRKVTASTPEAKQAAKLVSAQRKLAQWRRKLKLATTKAKHYQRQVNRLGKMVMVKTTITFNMPEEVVMQHAANKSGHWVLSQASQELNEKLAKLDGPQEVGIHVIDMGGL